MRGPNEGESWVDYEKRVMGDRQDKSRTQEIEALAEMLYLRSVLDSHYDFYCEAAECCFDMAETFIDTRDEWRKNREENKDG